MIDSIYPNLYKTIYDKKFKKYTELLIRQKRLEIVVNFPERMQPKWLYEDFLFENRDHMQRFLTKVNSQIDKIASVPSCAKILFDAKMRLNFD